MAVAAVGVAEEEEAVAAEEEATAAEVVAATEVEVAADAATSSSLPRFGVYKSQGRPVLSPACFARSPLPGGTAGDGSHGPRPDPDT